MRQRVAIVGSGGQLESDLVRAFTPREVLLSMQSDTS